MLDTIVMRLYLCTLGELLPLDILLQCGQLLLGLSHTHLIIYPRHILEHLMISEFCDSYCRSVLFLFLGDILLN